MITRIHNISQSPNDDRSYRGLILENELRAILISDPSTNESAAALHVNVGYYNDPDEIPGLANFCKNMLFSGTKKHPNFNEFNDYLSMHSGSMESSIYSDYTSYYFGIDPIYFEEALGRFADFFKNPLFNKLVMSKELNIIDEEHQRNLKDDDWLLNQLERFLANPSHPFSKFGTGSRNTLDTIPKLRNIDVYKKLISFHEKQYSSNLMALCVLGKESLNELEEIIIRLFSEIENKKIATAKITVHPFNEKHFRTRIFILPLMKVRDLIIEFPFPHSLIDFYKGGPALYWTTILNYEGRGSLIEELKSKNWIITLEASVDNPARCLNFFKININLTEIGLSSVDDIIFTIFQYIHLIVEEGANERIYQEIRDIAKLHFRFLEKPCPYSYANSIVKNISDFPIEEVLTATHLYTEWMPETIMSLAEYLVPEKIRIKIIANEVEDVVKESVSYYGIKFIEEKIPKHEIDRWKFASLNPNISLPNPNEFIPTEFTIKAFDEVDEFPTIIKNSDYVRFWFKQDNKYLIPKAIMALDFLCPTVYADPLSYYLSFMYVSMVIDRLKDVIYDSDKSGLRWCLTPVKSGFILCLSGYDHKFIQFLNIILKNMFEEKAINQQNFDTWKEQYQRVLENFDNDQPFQQADYCLDVLLSEKIWHYKDIQRYSNLVTLEMLENFIPLLFNKMYVEGILHGNFTKIEASAIADSVEHLIREKKVIAPVLPIQMLQIRRLKLQPGHYYYQCKNKMLDSVCTTIYYQIGLESPRINMLLEIFHSIISEPYYDEWWIDLDETLYCSTCCDDGIRGLKIAIQARKSPEELETRINKFIRSMEVHITDMEIEKFDNYVDTSMKNLLEHPQGFTAESYFFIEEMQNNQYNFDRYKNEANYLKYINKGQILSFYREFFSADSNSICKLTIYATPDAAYEFQQATKTTKISNVVDFKASLESFPLVKPSNNTPFLGI